LVIGTHARSIYAVDIAPLEEMTDKVTASDVYLFDIKPALTYMVKTRDTMAAPNGVTRYYTAPNPEFGATIYYQLKKSAAKAPTLTITDHEKKVVVKLTGPKEAGLHHVLWNLCGMDEDPPRVEPGDYTVTL